MKAASIRELKQENAKLRKDKSNLVQRIKSLERRQQEFRKQTGDLTEKQKQIYDIVKNNPGGTKQSIVDLSPISRKPTYKIIYELERYKMISVRVDENSQTHHVDVNQGNILSSVISQLDQFAQSFSNLLEQVKKIIKNMNWEDHDYQSLLSSIFTIFQHVANIYSAYGLLKWPGELQDRDLLNRLRVMIGVRLENLQRRILDAFHLHTRISATGRLTMAMTYNPLVRKAASNIFLLKLEKMYEIIEPFKRVQLSENTINQVIDTAWKTSFDILLWTEYNIMKWDSNEDAMNRLKDWRFALESYEGGYI